VLARPNSPDGLLEYTFLKRGDSERHGAGRGISVMRYIQFLHALAALHQASHHAARQACVKSIKGLKNLHL
jgi:hypothetical protein